jgi:hypothetical protein
MVIIACNIGSKDGGKRETRDKPFWKKEKLQEVE